MKKSLSALLIVGGLGLIGYFLLTRKKPIIRESQLAELTAQEEELAKSRISGIKPVDDLIKAQLLLKEVKIMKKDDLNKVYKDYVAKFKDLGYTLTGTNSTNYQIVKIK
jgi:hypothetical protein